MDDRDYRLAMYQSFFDELASIEKNAMLQKEAVGGWGAVTGALGKARKFIGEGVGQWRKTGLGGGLQTLRETGQRAAGAAPEGAGMFQRAGHALFGSKGGAPGILQTQMGQTAAAGLGAAGLGAGALGGGALALRGMRGQQQQ